MRGFRLALKIIDRIIDAINAYRKRQHEKRIEAIKHDPSGAWSDRFGRVQPTADPYDDAEQLPSDSANTARPEPGRQDSDATP